MNLGKAIRICCIRQDLKQKDLASLANISVSYLSLLERNKRDPNFSLIQKIVSALNVSLFVLIYFAAEHKDLEGFSLQLAQIELLEIERQNETYSR